MVNVHVSGSPGQSTCLFQIQFRVLCLVGVLLRQTVLTVLGAGVTYLTFDLNFPRCLAQMHFVT
jgi:hypothetical protein